MQLWLLLSRVSDGSSTALLTQMLRCMRSLTPAHPTHHTPVLPTLLCNASEVAYLHDSYVIREWSDSQPFDHDVRQVVGVQHQVIPAVLQELLIVLALILPHVAHCS